MDREIRKIKKETKHAVKDLGKLEKMDKKQDSKLARCTMKMKKK
jgi:hypothetical protein